MKLRRTACLGLALVGALTTWGLAEEVFVKSPKASVRAGKGPAHEEVASVKQGQPLEVIKRDGKWIKVRVAGKEGYIFENTVSAEKVSESNSDLSAFLKAGKASAATDALAAKGIDEEAEKWARAGSMDSAPLKKLMEETKKISGAEWEAFAADGKVGANR